MSLKFRYGGAWKDLTKCWIRSSGAWKQCDKVWIRHNGQWKVVWNAEPLWGEWSAWQATQVTAISGQREVKSEKQHRYQVYGMCYNFDDSFSPRFCHDKRTQDEFIKKPSCDSCGYRKAHEWGHFRGSWANDDGLYQCLCRKMFDSGIRWGYNGIKDGKSDWTSGEGGTDTSDFRVTDQRTAWSYRINLNDPPK